MSAYMDSQGNHFKLPDPVPLKKAALNYLREGGENEEAAVLAQCELELGFRDIQG